MRFIRLNLVDGIVEIGLKRSISLVTQGIPTDQQSKRIERTEGGFLVEYRKKTFFIPDAAVSSAEVDARSLGVEPVMDAGAQADIETIIGGLGEAEQRTFRSLMAQYGQKQALVKMGLAPGTPVRPVAPAAQRFVPTAEGLILDTLTGQYSRPNLTPQPTGDDGMVEQAADVAPQGDPSDTPPLEEPAETIAIGGKRPRSRRFPNKRS